MNWITHHLYQKRKMHSATGQDPNRCFWFISRCVALMLMTLQRQPAARSWNRQECSIPQGTKKKAINTSAFYSVQCNIHQRMDQRKTRRKKQFFKLDDAKSYASLADSIPRISLFLTLPSSLLSSVISVTLLSEPIAALILLPQRIPVTLLYKQLPGTGLMYSFRIVLQT